MNSRISQLTRVAIGLNDYRYEAALHISHPTIDVEAISAAMPFAPRRVCRAGDQRRNLDGTLCDGYYDKACWSTDLHCPGGFDVSEFLEHLVAQLSASEEFLFNLSKTGGESEIFIGLYADRCCDFAMLPTLLASCRRCAGGFDVLTAVQSLALVAAIVLWKLSHPIAAMLTVCVVVAFAMVLEIPFENTERWARARIRRGECTRCGSQTHDVGRC